MRSEGKAAIVMILGLSSVGKSNVIRTTQELAPDLNWVEDGWDFDIKRNPGIQERHEAIIASNPQSQKEFTDLVQKLDDGTEYDSKLKVLLPINEGKLNIPTEDGKITISLLDKSLDYETLASSLPHDTPYNREVIEGLQKLAQLHHDEFKEAWKDAPTTVSRMESMFDRAMENSMQGRPTIFDTLPPSQKYDTVAEFKKYMEEHNFSGPTCIVLNYCDVGEMIKNMDKRNASGEKGEERADFRPIFYYGEQYRVAQEGDKVIGHLTTDEIFEAVSKYGQNKGAVSRESLPEDKNAQDLLESLGAPKDMLRTSTTIPITTDIPYDYLALTRPKDEEKAKTAIVDVANHINSFASVQLSPRAVSSKKIQEEKSHNREHKSPEQELGEQLSRSGVSMEETPHYQRPTTSSLLKAGKLEEAMDHDSKFADMVKAQRAKNNGGEYSR